MDTFIRLVMITSVVFVSLTFLYNFFKLPTIPGDLFFDKFGFSIRVPFISGLVISVIVIFLTNQFAR